MKNFIWDINDAVKPLKPYWNMCVGSCHAATALRQDYREQLEKCRRELGRTAAGSYGSRLLYKGRDSGHKRWYNSLNSAAYGRGTDYHVSVIHGPREETYHEL